MIRIGSFQMIGDMPPSYSCRWRPARPGTGFRRALVDVGPERLTRLVGSYRHAWRKMPAIHRERRAAPSYDCWFCRRENWT